MKKISKISPEASRIIEMSNKLFKGITNYKDEDQIETLFKRYIEMKDEFEGFEPQTLNIMKV